MISTAAINLSKLNKSKLTKDKNGNSWLNFDILISDTPDKFGNDVALTLRQTKEEREAKEKKTYIGNGKVVWGKIPSNQAKAIKQDNADMNNGDDLPF